jgi:hypothetical protein
MKLVESDFNIPVIILMNFDYSKYLIEYANYLRDEEQVFIDNRSVQEMF